MLLKNHSDNASDIYEANSFHLNINNFHIYKIQIANSVPIILSLITGLFKEKNDNK